MGRYHPVLRGAIGVEDEVLVLGTPKDDFGHAPVTDKYLRGLRERFALQSDDSEMSCRRRKRICADAAQPNVYSTRKHDLEEANND